MENVKENKILVDIKNIMKWRFSYMRNNFQGLQFGVYNFTKDQDYMDYYNNTFINGSTLEKICHEYLIMVQSQSKDFKSPEPKRKIYAAMVITRLIGADEKVMNRSKFIIQHSEDIIAARYLSPVSGFLYVQAVSEIFEKTGAWIIEDLKRVSSIGELVSEQAVNSPDNALDLWKWIIETFYSYREFENPENEKANERAFNIDVLEKARENETLRGLAIAANKKQTVCKEILQQLADKQDNPDVSEFMRLFNIYENARGICVEPKNSDFSWDLDEGKKMADKVNSYVKNNPDLLGNGGN